MKFDKLGKYREKGLLVLRVGLGIMFIFHGYGKLVGGPEVWSKLGGALSYFGIGFGHTIFGFLAMLSEFLGGFCLILGLFFRPACLFLFLTMVVAAVMHLASGDGLKTASHAIEAGVVFFGLIFIGPGHYSLDRYL